MGNRGGARKGAGRKIGIGITNDIQKHCEKLIIELLKDDAIKYKATKQLSLTFNDVKKESVYIIESNGLYKIGYSSNFKKRINNYKTHLPEFNVLINAVTFKAFEIESLLHKTFSDKNKDGEWFCLNKKELIKALSLINEISYGW